MEERTRFQAWAPTLALVVVPAVAAALAIGLVPSRIKNVARRAPSTEDPSFYSMTSPEAAPSDHEAEPGEGSAFPTEVAALEPSSPVPPVGADPSASERAAEPASAAAPSPGDSVAAVNGETATPSANEAAAQPAPRPLVSVWPSARRLRKSARQAAAAEAAARASVSEADAPSTTATTAAEPTYVYVPVAVPLPMVEVTEGEASGADAAAPEVPATSGAGVAVFVNLPADE